ncbi:DEAD/DEAH box helicase [Candidatus Pacearchaeota archaeon]|nr:DEAD/DEAH box helicase [Candidatus Pacearchaeota archaeon]
MMDIIINESFSDEETILTKIENKQFESRELVQLRLDAEEVAQETEIKEILSYPKIKKNLDFDLPHQREGAIRILRDFNGTVLLADEVGLGKTITTGIVIREGIERGFIKRVLILTPPSLVDQWVAELKSKFELNFSIIENENSWDGVQYAIASIDRVKAYNLGLNRFRHYKAHEIPWDLLIVDEAHKLKDKSSIRWQFVDRMQKKRFLVLTATPFQNDLLELYNLAHLLKRGHFGTLQEFKQSFLHRGNKRFPLNPQELKTRLRQIMIRRRRDETGIVYMKRLPQIVTVELTPEEKSIYERTTDLLKTKYFTVDGNELNGRLIVFAMLPKVTSSSRSAMESLQNIMDNSKYHEKTKEIARSILNDYRQLAKDSKIEKLVELVTEIYAKDKNAKILMYTRHPTTLRYIIERLAPLKLHIVDFMGGLSREEKTAKIKEFKESAHIMISTETGAEGLNFQFCNNLINYDLPWNPMSVEQRIGRLDRIGQKRDMHIYSLAVKGTMEEHVVDLIINKMCCIGLVIGELPIILFNLGLDSRTKDNVANIEEMLMQSFLDSKNNLEVFAQEVTKIGDLIEKGIKDYQQAKVQVAKVVDHG